MSGLRESLCSFPMIAPTNCSSIFYFVRFLLSVSCRLMILFAFGSASTRSNVFSKRLLHLPSSVFIVFLGDDDASMIFSRERMNMDRLSWNFFDVYACYENLVAGWVLSIHLFRVNSACSSIEERFSLSLLWPRTTDERFFWTYCWAIQVGIPMVLCIWSTAPNNMTPLPVWSSMYYFDVIISKSWLFGNTLTPLYLNTLMRLVRYSALSSNI